MSGGTIRPLRVLQTVQSYFPFEDRGGPVVKVRALARGLAQRGHGVTVLTADLGFGKHGGQNGFKTKVERCRWGWRAEEDGVEAIYLSTFGHYRALTVNPHVIGFCEAALGQFDLVHFYGLYDLLGPAVGYFCKRQGIPYVIEPMGMYRPIDRSFRLKRVWHRILGGSFWQNAAQIVATSEMEQGELVDDGVPPEKIVIRHNGIDGNLRESLPARGSFRAKWNISPQEPVILFLGRLIPRKGADTLIDAFARVCPESGRLVIAGPEGEPGYRALLEKRAKESGAAGRVLFTGPLYGEEKGAVLADANVFALPSRYENFANSAAEAIACGVPVIISDSCGIRSLVSDRAGLVISSDKDALAGALRRLLSDKALYARLQDGCQAVAEQLSWNRLTEKMEGYYTEALARNNGIH
jgi:glycosyltransferase involved in cell wall biosynthesis